MYNQPSCVEVAASLVVALAGSMARVVSQGRWKGGSLGICMVVLPQLLRVEWVPLSMTSNSGVLCFASVGNTSVGGSLFLINPKKCISYHF